MTIDPRRSRSGMTLFALLLILAVIGMLTALLFPAVLKIRAAAAQMRCGNNLSQVMIGVHNYHNDRDFFPKDGGDGKKSWQWEIRAYIEQRLNDGSQPVNLLYSPTRRPAKIYDDKAKTDYAGNGGTADDPAKPGKDDSPGLFGGIKIDDVKDGTSNTLYAGLKGLRTTDYLTGKGEGDKTSWHEGAVVDRIRSSNGDSAAVPRRRRRQQTRLRRAHRKNLQLRLVRRRRPAHQVRHRRQDLQGAANP